MWRCSVEVKCHRRSHTYRTIVAPHIKCGSRNAENKNKKQNKTIEAMKWEAVNQDSRDFRGNGRTHPQQWPRRYPYDHLCTTACGRATHTDAEWRHSANMAPLGDSSRSSTSSVRRASRVVILWRVLEATIAPPCALHWVVTPGRNLFVVHREGECDILALRVAQPSFTPVFVFDC